MQDIYWNTVVDKRVVGVKPPPSLCTVQKRFFNAACTENHRYLSCFDVLADKRVVGHGELGRVIVDIQHLDEHGHSSCLTWIIWDDYIHYYGFHGGKIIKTITDIKKQQLLISVATTEMLCHLDVSRSSDFSVVIVPFTESMLNSLSRSVWRSMEYLQEIMQFIHSSDTEILTHIQIEQIRQISNTVVVKSSAVTSLSS